MKTRRIDKPAVNIDKLVEELTAIGLQSVTIGFGGGQVNITADDSVPDARIDALVAGIQAHDHTVQTAGQVEEAAGRADVDGLVAQIDNAIADIASKKAALQATPNLANATALLNELAQDTTGILKALKYVIRKVL